MATPETVRPMRPDEFPAVRELLSSVYAGEGYSPADRFDVTLDLLSGECSGDCYVATDGATLLGFVTFLRPGDAMAQISTEHEAEFRLLAVDPDARGRGVAEALVRCCVEIAVAEGAERLVLSTQPTMEAAHRLYHRLGFDREPHRDWPRPNAPPMLVFARTLR